ncbi:MAG: hypothetical protein KKA90_05040 [Nanoarchaeota archaeon]|nr:hypothetical protein [Nanoarchaeota archaeon]
MGHTTEILLIGITIVILFFIGSGLLLLPQRVSTEPFEQYEFFLFSTETTHYPTNVTLFASTVGNRTIEVTVDRWNLNFGGFEPNESATRGIEFENPNDVMVKAQLFAFGNISPYLILPEDFLIGPGLSKNISLTLDAKGAVSGNYSGTISVRVVIPRFSALEGVLPLL